VRDHGNENARSPDLSRRSLGMHPFLFRLQIQIPGLDFNSFVADVEAQVRKPTNKRLNLNRFCILARGVRQKSTRLDGDEGEISLKIMKLRLFVLAVLLGVTSTICLAQTAPATAPETATPDKKASKPKTKSAPVDPSTITQAPGGGGGKVWVNTNTKVFHKEGDPWYGKTKHGSYMTEADAVKAGFHEAKDSPVGKKDAMKK
jgi:hypothetical protein